MSKKPTKQVDLRKCKPGDVLISCHGTRHEYTEYKGESSPVYAHKVRHLEGGGRGSRTDDGCSFLRNREETDNDIVKVIRGKRVMQSGVRKPL